MKKLKTVALLIVIILATGCGKTKKTNKSSNNVKTQNEIKIEPKKNEEIKQIKISNNIKALDEIKAEPKIKEALITDANVLYVTVEDDGTNRNGYAEYLCQLLNDYKATANWVKVIKVNSTKDINRDNDYGVLLGESHCN